MMRAAVVGETAMAYFADLLEDDPAAAAAFALESLKAAAEGRVYDFEAAGVPDGKRMTRICNRELQFMAEAREAKEEEISRKRAAAGRASWYARQKKAQQSEQIKQTEQKEQIEQIKQSEQIEQVKQSEQVEQTEQTEHKEMRGDERRRDEMRGDNAAAAVAPPSRPPSSEFRELARILADSPAPITAAEVEASAVRRGVPWPAVLAWAAYWAEMGWRDKGGTPLDKRRARGALMTWHTNNVAAGRPFGGGGRRKDGEGGGGGVYVGGVGPRGGGGGVGGASAAGKLVV